MTHVLVVYGSLYGQTAKVGRRIAEQLTNAGVRVTVLKGDAMLSELRIADYDGIVVGASVIRGRYQDYIERFVTQNLAALQRVPSAFFGVSGSAASKSATERVAADYIMQAFLAKTGWRPALTASVAGAMAFTKYNWLMRLVLKWISSREGGPTDTSRDHEMTDWAQVARFARDFAGLLDASALPQELQVGAG
jgi:menaquinone-dependent protoporphyrinogen oxidase